MKIKYILPVFALYLFADAAIAAEVFSDATAKAKEVFEGLRTLAFVLSGFGIVAMATSAIFGKLSFKWLVMICSGLFILASAEQLAEIVTGEGSSIGGGGGATTPSPADDSTPGGGGEGGGGGGGGSGSIPNCSTFKTQGYTDAQIDEMRNADPPNCVDGGSAPSAPSSDNDNPSTIPAGEETPGTTDPKKPESQVPNCATLKSQGLSDAHIDLLRNANPPACVD